MEALRRARVIALAASVAAIACASSAAAQTNSGGSWHFVSSPRLNPPSVAITTNAPGTAPGYVFLAPNAVGGAMLGQPGPLMIDNQGNPVFVRPMPHGLKATDFRPQQTSDRTPVLTWWQGTFTSSGIGNGQDVIMDQHYNVIATIRAGRGYQADLHELKLAPHANAAFITAYKVIRLNLTGCCHGPANGEMWDSVVQEIDLRTGRVIWQWDPLRHVRLRESYTKPVQGYIWDPYHLNSIDIADNGDLLLSMRNTWGVYEVSRRKGRINWRLGGKQSSFTLGQGVQFAWQHHARFQPNNDITIFDDEAAPKVRPLSRAIRVHLDFTHRAAQIVYSDTHPGILAGSQGSLETLPNGNVFVGWGQKPYFSEYSPSGQLLFDGHFYGRDQSYRAYRMPWVGRPTTAPALVSLSGTLYCSWNGETGISAWQLLSGPSPAQLAPAGTVQSQGFETAINPRASGPYFQVKPLDSTGAVLGASPVVRR
jgi:hypothetical protein